MCDSRGVGSSSLLNPLPLVEVRLVPTLLRELVEVALDPEEKPSWPSIPFQWGGGGSSCGFLVLEDRLCCQLLGLRFDLDVGRWAGAFPAVRAVAYIASSSYPHSLVA